jgi:heparanase 1
LTDDWLARTTLDLRWYVALRDRFDPGKPIGLTETAQAACGGDHWASSFRDSFRFVDQLGRLAQSGVQIVAHNTLASGDYALIDRNSVEPRPNFWLAWLWKQTMGRSLLRSSTTVEGVNLYAH